MAEQQIIGSNHGGNMQRTGHYFNVFISVLLLLLTGSELASSSSLFDPQQKALILKLDSTVKCNFQNIKRPL